MPAAERRRNLARPGPGPGAGTRRGTLRLGSAPARPAGARALPLAVPARAPGSSVTGRSGSRLSESTVPVTPPGRDRPRSDWHWPRRVLYAAGVRIMGPESETQRPNSLPPVRRGATVSHGVTRSNPVTQRPLGRGPLHPTVSDPPPGPRPTQWGPARGRPPPLVTVTVSH
eukprot:764823-Hanusia_phi.AAC.1